jgi:hypothetical protein
MGGLRFGQAVSSAAEFAQRSLGREASNLTVSRSDVLLGGISWPFYSPPPKPIKSESSMKLSDSHQQPSHRPKAPNLFLGIMSMSWVHSRAM